MNDWIKTHETTDVDNACETVTEALELPHGCLVRTTVTQGSESKMFKGTVTVAQSMAFVPGLALERRQDAVEFKFKH